MSDDINLREMTPDELLAECNRLRAELAEAEEDRDAADDLLGRFHAGMGAMCIYCGMSYPLDANRADLIRHREHECKADPMKARAEAAEASRDTWKALRLTAVDERDRFRAVAEAEQAKREAAEARAARLAEALRRCEYADSGGVDGPGLCPACYARSGHNPGCWMAAALADAPKVLATCEQCGAPSTTTDSEGVPLCVACWEALDHETEEANDE